MKTLKLWVSPAALIAVWIVAAAFTLSQLATVGLTLDQVTQNVSDDNVALLDFRRDGGGTGKQMVALVLPALTMTIGKTEPPLRNRPPAFEEST